MKKIASAIVTAAISAVIAIAFLALLLSFNQYKHS
jgi:hypothetical protein